MSFGTFGLTFRSIDMDDETYLAKYFNVEDW